VILLLSLLACAPRYAPGEVMPSFTLPDANPASATFNQQVGPETYRGQVSAWYFGHST